MHVHTYNICMFIIKKKICYLKLGKDKDAKIKRPKQFCGKNTYNLKLKFCLLPYTANSMGVCDNNNIKWYIH